jgi:hypothetical protein
MYTGGQTDVGVSFGFASFNFNKNKWGYLGEKGNSTLENIGYGFGALANLQDIVAWNRGTEIDVYSRSDRGLAGHSEIRGDEGSISISVGPHKSSLNLKPGTDGLKWESQYLRHSVRAENVEYIDVVGDVIEGFAPDRHFKTHLFNVNGKLLSNMTDNLNSGKNLFGFGNFKYSVLRGCVNYTSRALLYAGVPTVNAFLPITSPVFLNFELAVRQLGIYASPILNNGR